MTSLFAKDSSIERLKQVLLFFALRSLVLNCFLVAKQMLMHEKKHSYIFNLRFPITQKMLILIYMRLWLNVMDNIHLSKHALTSLSKYPPFTVLIHPVFYLLMLTIFKEGKQLAYIFYNQIKKIHLHLS